MAREVKAATTFYPTVDTEFDLFKEEDNFGLEIRNASNGELVTNDASGTWAEVMWTDPGHSAKTSGDSPAGQKYITVVDDSSNTLVAGDRIDDGNGNIYYVTKVSSGNVYLKRALVADIADGTDLSTVGNTGIYKADVQIADEGEYLVDIQHPVMGHATVKYIVTAHNVDDVYDRLDKGLNELGATETMKVIA